MTYVGGGANTHPGCIFCNALHGNDDPESLVILRREHCFLILNRYPYNTGHAMVVPNAHAATVEELDSATRAEMFELATLVTEVSRTVLRCNGFNLGLNIGDVAGAGIAQHLHLHVVPRWTGDANFMPILADTMVMPELLPVTYARLRAELECAIAAREHDAVTQAGALVVLPDRAVIVLRRSKSGDIVIPKGHIEPGETAATAAVREVLEETGVSATLAGWAGNQSFIAPDDGRPHHITFFVATGTLTDDVEQHLNDDTLFAPLADAADLMSFNELADLIRTNLPNLRRLVETAS
jgi:ATP adenylyltransferase